MIDCRFFQRRSALTLSAIMTLAAGAAETLGAQTAQRAASGAPRKLASVEGISEYELSNGLKVLLFPDPSKPTVTVNITYFVGSRHEGYGETGMAHLLEHLVFKGTPRHPNIPQELTSHGARPNGTTWFDRTNYFETVPATEVNLDWALDLEADRMVNSYIAKKDLVSEFSVVRNEFESGENDPFSVLLERAVSTSYLWHNYGNSTIGARADIENVPIERLQAFYRRYYQPDNAMLVVAGKFDEAATLRLIQRKFGGIPRPRRSLNAGNILFPTYTAEPTQDGERQVTLRRVGDVQVAEVVYHVPAGSHSDYAAVDVLTEVIGSSPSGRLYKALVETKKAASTGAFSFQLREPGVMIGFANVRKEMSLDTAASILVRTLEGTAAAAPTSEEVDRAKVTLLKNIDLTLNSSERVGLELSEWAAGGDWRLLFLHRDRVRKVKAVDVRRVAATYLKQANRTLALFIPTEKPDRAEIPAVSDVAAMVRDYKGDPVRSVGEAFDPSPTNIETRTKRSTLGNGFELALLPKSTRGNTVFAVIDLRFGSEQSLTNKATSGGIVPRMLMRGTTNRTRQQIKDELDRLQARVNLTGGPTSARVSIETTRPNLPPVLRLVGEVLKSPAFDAKEMEQLREELLALAEEQKSEPTALAQLTYQRTMNPWPKGHPSYISTLDEDVVNTKAVSVDQVKKFHSDFYGVARGMMAVVGDFNATEVTAIATELFGSWKSTTPFERIAVPYRDIAATSQTIATPDKENAYFMAGLNIALRDDDADYPAVALANYILGGGFLNSRLATRIRQKEGISYGVGSQLSARPLDRSGQFTTFAIYAPQNAAKLEAAFKEEIARMLKDGFTATELNEARSGYLQQRLQSRANDNSLAAALANQLYLKRTTAYDIEFEKRIAALTPQQLVEAMRKHVDPSKITIIKAGDFTKTGK